MIKNKYLFVFENASSAIVETKVLEQPEGTHPSRVYFWLLIDKKTLTVTPLKFISMQKEPQQIRIFEQGKLSFDSDSAILNKEYFETSKTEIKGSLIDTIVLNYLKNVV